MSAIACRLLYRSNSPHLQQLYTGFLLLHGSGFVRLSQQPRRSPIRYEDTSPHLRDAGHAHLDAVVGGDIRLHFDTHDAREVAVGELDGCDFYFKRSWSPDVVSSLPSEQRRKVLPLGLNYCVMPDGVDLFAIRRFVSLSGFARPTLSALKRSLDSGNRFGFQPRLTQMEAPPHPEAAASVLFLVAAYDPYDDPSRSQEKIDERIALNETRARCIRLLKDALGTRFLGGFSSSRFTLEHYPDLLAPPGSTSQHTYLAALRSRPICVATSGLHGSTGWKFAEYVAFSKAIVSEQLLYGLPGTFGPGRNYLEFTSPEECLNCAVHLIEDAALRREIMANNAAYYRSAVRPDAMVRNALTTALELKKS